MGSDIEYLNFLAVWSEWSEGACSTCNLVDGELIRVLTKNRTCVGFGNCVGETELSAHCTSNVTCGKSTKIIEFYQA